jgi:pyridoxamine 5'-phosphate oxidase
LGAWASPQSEPIAGRNALMARFAAAEAQYADAEPCRALSAALGRLSRRSRCIEFWQGRASRLHDRIRYRRQREEPSAWVIDRLAP